MSNTPETVLNTVHQGACCCGAMRMADGTWNKLLGITDRLVSFVTFDPAAHETTVHLVSHGYCPSCLKVAHAQMMDRRRWASGEVETRHDRQE